MVGIADSWKDEHKNLFLMSKMFYKMSILNILYTALVLNNGNIKYLSKMLPKVLKYKK